MKRQEAEALGAVAGIGTLVVVAGVVGYVKVAREERRKRKSIEVWRKNTLSAVEAARQRLTDMKDDPTTTSGDLIRAWIEEQKFIKLIEDQPKY
jgi:hypothetical protein